MIPFVKNPTGSSVKQALTFKALQNNSSVKLTQTGTPNSINLYYKTSSSAVWAPYTIGTQIPLSGGQSVKFWNKSSLFSKDSSNYFQFVMVGKIAASGNAQSLLNFSKQAPNSCFAKLFQNCTVLATAPILPALTVGNYSYFYMFAGCTSLVTAPKLPATTLAAYCYYHMFDTTALISAPELPATTLASDCYQGMFWHCVSLVTAPELPATTLALACYSQMFGGCTSLVTAPELPATTLVSWCYESMFNTCRSLISAPELPATTLASNCYYGMFGGCTSLVTAPELPATTLAPYCYQTMFKGCTSLVTAPELLATTLAYSCYQEMFSGCTSLTTAPELPATTLANNCYRQMFNGCTSLTEAPELPATTLIINCYLYMFYGCTSLVTAPQLPATVITQQAYYGMFQGCTSLTEAPELHATAFIGTYNCYGMFYGCTSLTTAPALPATTLTAYCYSQMFQGCTSLTTAPELPATTLAANCYHSMFYGCSKLKEINASFTDWNASNNATTNWVSGVAASGVFIKPAQLLEGRGASRIPSGWTVINKVDYLQSTGTQYIDTGIKVTGEYRIQISLYEALPNATSNVLALYGARDSDNRENLLFSSISNKRQWWCGNAGIAYRNLAADRVITDYETRPDGGNMWLYLNGSDTAATSLSSFSETINQNMYLFTANLKGNATYCQPCKITKFRIWNAGGIPIMNLIPVLDSSGVPCMYDTVTKTFKYNAGTGTFNYA